METWDPKPDAVAQFRGPFGAIRTTVPGVQFGELLPEQARIMDRLAVLRTVNHGTGDHTKANHWMLTGFEGPAFNAPDFMVQRRPSMGSAVAKLRGPNRPGLPPYVAVPHLRGGTDNFFHYAAYLGGGRQPVHRRIRPEYAGISRQEPGPAERPAARPAGRPPPRPRRPRRPAPPGRPRRRRPGPALPAGLLPADRARDGARPSTSPASRRRCATATAGTPSARAPCWPGAWSRPASPSSRSTACRGTTTARRGGLRTDVGGKLLIPPFDRALAALVEDLIAARPVREDAGGGDGRVRPHAAHERRGRPRPLGRHLQRADGLRRR